MKTISFSQLGKRSNQEDTLGYTNNLFFVCDGVGGHTKGEVASNFIKDFILENPIEIKKLNIEKLLIDAQTALNKKYGQNPETIGMGTTFCGLFFSKNSAYIAYIGDSRLYWLKPNQNLVWHTWDHSIVGELVKSGEITREEGRKHPMNNRISKVIVANKENKTTTPEIYKIDKIDKEDIFFLCTDGVNEAWSDHDLIATLVEKGKTVADKLEVIQKKCELESNDNNTAIIIEIEKDNEIDNGNNNEIKWILTHTIFENAEVKENTISLPIKNREHEKVASKSLKIFFLVILVLLSYYIWNKK